MADDRVDVIFGAKVGELLAGVAEAKHAIEGMRAPIDSFVGSLGHITEAIGVAFAVEKIKEFAVEMSELGEKMLNAAFVVGASVEEYTRLAGAFTLLSVNADGAQHVMEFLGHSIQTALQDPTGKAATGFKNLGISMAEVRAHANDLTGFLKLIIERVNELTPGLQRAGAMRDVLGRGMQELAPLLRAGAEGFDEAQKGADAYAKAQAKAVEPMERSNALMDKLKLSSEHLGTASFVLLKDSIDGMTGVLTAIVDALTWFVTKLHEADTAVQRLANDIQRSFGAEGTSLMTKEQIEAAGGGMGAIPGAHTHPPGTAKPGGAKGAGGDDRFSIMKDQLRQQLEAERNFLSDSRKEEEEFWRNKLATIAGGGKKEEALRRQIRSQIFDLEKRGAKEDLQAALDLQDYRHRYDDIQLEQKRAFIEADIQLGKISVQEGIAQEKQLLDEKLKATKEFYTLKYDAAEGDSKLQKRLARDRNLEIETIGGQMAGLDIKSAEKQHEDMKSLLQPITSSIGSAIEGLIKRQQTFGQAAAGVGQAGLSEVMSRVMSSMTDRLANVLQSVLPEAMKSALGIGEASAQVAATTAGSAAIVAAIESGNILLASIAVKPSAAGFSYAGGGIVSAQGGYRVPNTGSMAMLHPKEMVLPAHISTGLQDMISKGNTGGGTTNLIFNGPSDGASIDRWHKNLVQRNPGAIRDLFRSNALTPRSV